MSYDSKCYDLAVAFLDDCENVKAVTERDYGLLAQDIQDTIETYLQDVEARGKA